MVIKKNMYIVDENVNIKPVLSIDDEEIQARSQHKDEENAKQFCKCEVELDKIDKASDYQSEVQRKGDIRFNDCNYQIESQELH